MITTDPWWDTIYSAVSFGIAAFAVIAVLVKRIEQQGQPRLHLEAIAVFLSLQALDMIDSLLWDAPTPYPQVLAGVISLFYPLFMVSLWVFVRAITSADARLTQKDLWHLAPLGLGALCHLPLLTLPVSERYNLVAGVAPSQTSLHVGLAAMGDLLFWVLWIFLLVLYSYLCARRLWQHQRNIRTLFADLDGRRLRWLTALVVCILGLAWSVVIEELLALLFAFDVVDGWVQGTQEILISGLIGFFALRAEPALKPWTKDVLSRDTAQLPLAASPDAEPASGKRYARSGLDTDRLARLRRKIDGAMERDKIWRQQGLRLKDLSDVTGITPIHLSEVLNTEIGESFYDYVNGYRIRDACAFLRHSEDTVLTIGETVGFASKSTFNSQFKKVTGQTPSAFRASGRASDVP